MILERIEIRKRASYEKGGAYKGGVRFVGESAAIEIELDETTSQKVLAVLAEQLVAHSRKVAESLTAETVIAIGKIESKAA